MFTLVCVFLCLCMYVCIRMCEWVTTSVDGRSVIWCCLVGSIKLLQQATLEEVCLERDQLKLERESMSDQIMEKVWYCAVHSWADIVNGHMMV